jgi:hypothetical protein
MSDRLLIRPGPLEAARGEYDRRRRAELKRERAELRAAELERLARKLDRIDLELAGLGAIRTRQLAVDLARHGFDTSQLRPTPYPSDLEREARRRRGRGAPADATLRARQEEAADRGRLIRTFNAPIRVR